MPPFRGTQSSRLPARVGALFLLLLLVLLSACGSSAAKPKGANVRDIAPTSTVWTLPPSAIPHVFVIMMENKNPEDIKGNSGAPYLNSLIGTYGFASSYYGVTHPSLPNYVATIAGSYLGSNSDAPSQRFSARNLVDQLDDSGKSWKAYMESYPGPGFLDATYPATQQGLYVVRHNPFLLMDDIRNNPSRQKQIVSMAQFNSDLQAGQVPDFSYIVPNLCHDMHGVGGSHSPCPYNGQALIEAGDRYLSRLVPRIMHSTAWTDDSVIFIIWDENDNESAVGCCDGPNGNGGGKVPAIIIARQGVRHYVSHATYNHYSLLKTIETIWQLGCVGQTCDRKDISPMTEFLTLHR